MLNFIFRYSVKGRLSAKKVHWVMGGFLPQKLFPESFKEILGQQKCQGWSRLQITFSQNGYYANLKENNMTELNKISRSLRVI